MAASATVLDVELADMARATKQHYIGCGECTDVDLCATGTRVLREFLETSLRERRLRLNGPTVARTTVCNPYGRRVVVTARVA